jgi:antitoxin component of MazEF toxin-antitoxin module
MLKTLTPHGNSLALVIEKPILQLLNIQVGTPLSITTNGRNIVVTPVQNKEEGVLVRAKVVKGKISGIGR